MEGIFLLMKTEKLLLFAKVFIVVGAAEWQLALLRVSAADQSELVRFYRKY